MSINLGDGVTTNNGSIDGGSTDNTPRSMRKSTALKTIIGDQERERVASVTKAKNANRSPRIQVKQTFTQVNLDIRGVIEGDIIVY